MKTSSPPLALRCVASAFLIAAPALGQHLLREITGPLYPYLPVGSEVNGGFGRHTAFLGDIDADGYDDVVIAAPIATELEYRGGAIYAYSVRTGEQIWSVFGSTEFEELGSDLTLLGRIDDDSISDFMVSSALSPNHIEIRSGANGSILSTPSFAPTAASFLTAAGDLDGDSYGDYFVTYFVGGFQIIYVVSGFANSVLRTYDSPQPEGERLRAVRLGDLNFDGREDYAVTRSCYPSICNGGFDVFSGADGSVLLSRTHSEPLFGMLTTVIPLGDFDGDGSADLLWRQVYAQFGAYNDVVIHDEILSGSSGLELGSLPANRPYFAGSPFSDLNGDGREEYLSRQGDVLLVDPSDFSILRRVRRLPTDPDAFGRQFATGGDADADGIPDFMFTTSTVSFITPVRGRVLVFSGDMNAASNSFCFGDQSGCVACPCGNNAIAGSGGGCSNSDQRSAQLLVQGIPSVSTDTMRFELRRASPNTVALLLSAESALSSTGSCSPLSGTTDSLLGGLRCIGGSLRRHGTRISDADGSIGLKTSGWGFPDDVPGELFTTAGFSSGQTRNFQGFYRDSVSSSCGTGIQTTNGVSVTARP